MAHYTRVLPLLIWLLAIGGGNAAMSTVWQHSQEDEECPRCDMIFSMIETTSRGERLQNVETQERGEPKSGTTFAYVWAHGALVKTCDFLNEWFGSNSCHVHGSDDNGVPLEKAKKLTFDPRPGIGDAKCPCPEVDRVEILISHKNKHRLPVESGCRYQHVGTIAVEDEGCLSVNGEPVENYYGIERCVEEADCTIEDARFQFVVMRDPRAEAVSTFYHEIVHHHDPQKYHHHWIGFGLKTIDEFVMATLPVLCQWLTIRYLVFTGAMAEQSTIFWYSDAVADPTSWHSDWLQSVGVHLPVHVVEDMANAATNDQFSFKTPGKNKHPGEVTAESEETDEAESLPSWKTEISPELMDSIDNIMHTWLPPAVLARIEARESFK